MELEIQTCLRQKRERTSHIIGVEDTDMCSSNVRAKAGREPPGEARKGVEKYAKYDKLKRTV